LQAIDPVDGSEAILIAIRTGKLDHGKLHCLSVRDFPARASVGTLGEADGFP
jgi:hypothetical protein